jgi:hypothetical protein
VRGKREERSILSSGASFGELLGHNEASSLQEQKLARHRPVLALLCNTQARDEGVLSHQVAPAFNKHTYFAKKLVQWEGKWIQKRVIPEGKRG